MSEQPIAAGRSSFDLIDPEKVFAELGLASDTVLYDLACGVGKYTLEAARRMGPKGLIHALDLWPEGIAALQGQVEKLGLKNVRPLCCDVSGRIPLDVHSVDLCLMATVLHDLAHDGTAEGTLAEVARVLKPGGRLVVIEFYKVDSHPGPPVAIRLSEQQVDALVGPFGFTRKRIAQVGPHNYLVSYLAQGR